MANFPIRVQQTIDRGYEFNFGDYISKGINLVTKNAGLFIAFTFIFLLITVVLSFIPLLGQLASSFIVGPCLGAGFLIAARRTDEGRELEFGDFFKGFDHLGQLALMSLITVLVMVVVAIPFLATVGFSYFTMISSGDIPEIPPFWTLLLLLPIIYLAIAWSMGTYLIVFHGMKAWPALEASRQIVTKKWGFFFLLFLVAGILAALGFIVLIIGILFTYAIMPCAQYAAFRDIVGVADEDAVDLDITAHLVD